MDSPEDRRHPEPFSTQRIPASRSADPTTRWSTRRLTKAHTARFDLRLPRNRTGDGGQAAPQIESFLWAEPQGDHTSLDLRCSSSVVSLHGVALSIGVHRPRHSPRVWPPCSRTSATAPPAGDQGRPHVDAPAAFGDASQKSDRSSSTAEQRVSTAACGIGGESTQSSASAQVAADGLGSRRGPQGSRARE